MQILRSLLIRLCAVALAAYAGSTQAADSPREKLLLDFGWKFHLGNDWGTGEELINLGISTGPAKPSFNDSAWTSVDLPHDWAVALPFDRSANGSEGFKPRGTGFPQNSVGWYRRTFTLPADDLGKRLWLDFGGVFRDSLIYLNGCLIGRQQRGYNSFRYDITDVANYGGKNVLAVRVDASQFEGWFYEGAGIYRHVWLVKTAPVAIAPDGIFVSSKPPGGCTEIDIQTELQNSQTNSAKTIVNCDIFSPDQKLVGNSTYVVSLASRSEQQVESVFFLYPTNQFFSIPVVVGSGYKAVSHTPILWSPENPKLYKLITTVSVDDKIVDQKETEFGIRTLAFDVNRGFLLNGQPYVIKGTCDHQDHAGVGWALPDALQYFRVKKLKEMGGNAIRTAHNEPTEELLEACDHLGMLVMDESRTVGSDADNLGQLEFQIRRDRNHPSVFLWSIGNEEPIQNSPLAARVATTMQNLIHRLDPTRQVTYAASVGNEFTGINSVTDVRGWNYHAGGDMDKYHAAHPAQPEIGSEQASTLCTRGIYEDDRARGYVTAYDVRGTDTAEHWWSYFAERPWLSGGFAWTGFDYRGENGWPCINSHYGILDTCGFPKDNFWYYQSWWTTNTVLHLLPHWNWPGKEGQEIRVDALSNCKQVELFLNGASLGKQAMKPNSKLSWQVKYAPGTLSAKGFDGAGNVIAETKVETTGDATQIQLTPDRKTINADGEDVPVFTVSTLDAQGRVVPVAQNKINFSIEGAGKIIGVGNGDPSCHEPDTFAPLMPVHTIAVHDWRWKLAKIPNRGALAPEYAPDFDDSSWNTIKAKTDGDTGGMFLNENETAIYRAHLKMSEDDLNNPGVQIRFSTIDDHGWVFVNNQRVGESHDWSAQPVFDIKKALHAGDNVVAVDVKNDGGTGGMNPDVNVEITGKPTASPWSRSLFNGLAQIIVQSTKNAGEIKLTASADGLQSATVSVQMQTCTPRPSVP